jgi:hypothetical protein
MINGNEFFIVYPQRFNIECPKSELEIAEFWRKKLKI